MKKYLMAIDAGTGSVRAVIFDTQGNQLGVSQREWEHREDPRFPGSMDFDWIHNWGLTVACIRDVLAETAIAPESVAAIATTCMREGIVLLDGDGNEIWACANVDARSNDEVAELISRSATLEAEIYHKSGQTYSLGALPRILWVKNKLPEVYSKTATVMMFNDWLIYKLTGEYVSEPSNSCTTGIFDLTKRAWAPEIAQACGLKSDIFTEMRESGEYVANVSAAAAAETGLSPATRVITGGGDAQLGCIGVGATGAGEAAVFGGSFWQFEYNINKPLTDPNCRVRVNCHAVPGLWQYEALAFNPGLVMRWFRDAFCMHEKEAALAHGCASPYAFMDEQAAKIPAGSNGMLCAFSDVMNYITWKHAAPTFANFALDADRFNLYTFYRAIMENACMVTRGNIELVRESTGSSPEYISFASGAAQSPLWAQILADVTGLRVVVPCVREATALGAAILAGVGAGIYTNAAEAAAELVKTDREFLPDSESRRVYDEIYPRWREFYSAQLALCDKKLTRNMWIAPGID